MRNEFVVAGILVILSGFAVFAVSQISFTQQGLVPEKIPIFRKTITVPFREYALIEKFWFDASLEGWTSYVILFDNSDFSQYSVNITDPDDETISATDSDYFKGWDFSFKTKSEGLYNFLVDGTYLTTKAEIDETIDVTIYELVERTETHYPYGFLLYLAVGSWVAGIIISLTGLIRKSFSRTKGID